MTTENKFFPSINNIYFKDFDIVEDSDGIRHIRGDLYTKTPFNENSRCIGHYNPVYKPNEDAQPQYFLRLEEDYQFLYETEGTYESIFNKNKIPLAEYDCPVGFKELIADLEIITYLYEFMHGIRPNCDFENIGMIGLINGADEQPLIKVIQIKDNKIRTKEQILKFINNNIESIKFNDMYPIMIFRNIQDFNILIEDGKMLDIIEQKY